MTDDDTRGSEYAAHLESVLAQGGLSAEELAEIREVLARIEAKRSSTNNGDDSEVDDTALDEGYHEPETTYVPRSEPAKPSHLAWSDETGDETEIRAISGHDEDDEHDVDADDDEHGDDEQDDDDDDEWTEEDRVYEARTVQIFVGLIAIAVVGVAVLAGMWFNDRHHNDSAPRAASPPTARDEMFGELLARDGININPDRGHEVCTIIATERSPSTIADNWFYASDQSSSRIAWGTYVMDALDAYCPQGTPSPLTSEAPAP